MWTIENRKIIRGAAEHEAAGLGKAVDYVAVFEDIASPVDGVVSRIYTGVEGGNWLWIVDAKERTWKLAHLKNRIVWLNETIKRGKIIGVSGATGKPKPPLPPYKPHLHLEVWQNGQRQDPEIIIRELLNPPMPDYSQYNDKIIRNTKTGGFALVIHQKKYVFGRGLAGESQDDLALLTILTRNKTLPSVQVDDATFNAIPLSNGLDF